MGPRKGMKGKRTARQPVEDKRPVLINFLLLFVLILTNKCEYMNNLARGSEKNLIAVL
jgi:hypothetical protein